jgi:hypothetical protein
LLPQQDGTVRIRVEPGEVVNWMYQVEAELAPSER